MKRHAALIPLSHDHHHALVEARRLRLAADREDDPEPAAAAFTAFFAAVSVPHFREEEETMFRSLLVSTTLERWSWKPYVARGRRRRITAGRAGVTYLSVHLRRPSLQIQTR